MSRTNLCLLLLLFLPSFLCDNLGCFFSRVMKREREQESSFELIKTYCPPDYLCYKADGRYGNQSILSARGCMLQPNCSDVYSIRYLGTVYEISYACCDWPYCNCCLGVAAGLLHLSAILLAAAVVTGSV